MKSFLFILTAICLSSVLLGAQTANDHSSKASLPPIDADGDGKITYDEFAAHHAAQLHSSHDLDGDGKVTKDEITQVNQRDAANKISSRATIKHSIADTNDDGVITLEEMNQKVKSSPEVKTLFNGINKDRPKDNWANQAEYDSWVGSDSYDPQGQEGFKALSISF